MKNWTAYMRAGLGIGFVGLFLGGCASTLPAPVLKISPADTTYVKVIPAPQPVGITMTTIAVGGVAAQTANSSTLSQSQRFYALVKDDPRTQTLQQRFRDRVIAEAKSAGLALQDGQDLDISALASNQQMILLKGFNAYYQAKTIAHRYTPYAFTFIESSRDPVIPKGERHILHTASARIEDDKYAFALSDGVFNDLNVSLDGLDAAVDELAKRVVKELLAAR
ncbi:hypothetical protein [uncultured Ralstonia sp.]|jgi:hypothetical protein|uniref:hypothetical protein n=1 Tax=uncultured Ralstonia sp. TaxID=114715 RepID=UPI0025E09813|nr:hypothetical protein [uncultured Ralstonia sp.]